MTWQFGKPVTFALVFNIYLQLHFAFIFFLLIQTIKKHGWWLMLYMNDSLLKKSYQKSESTN